MQVQTQRVNVVFLPSEELLTFQLKLAAEIATGKDVRFYIDNESYFAHMSVYPLTFPTANWNSVFKVAEFVASRLSPLNLSFWEFYYGERWNNVGIGFIRTQDLVAAQDRIVNTLNQLREGCYPEWYDTEIAEGRITGRKAEFIRRYGTPNIFRFWEPHLTLALFREPHDAKKAAVWLKSQKVPHTQVTELAIVETDQYGTCTGIIQRFPFGK